MTMYERIKQLREARGMSQQMLAEMVGFKTASAINKIEMGLRDINQTKIIAIAKALDVSPCYLLSGGEPNAQINKPPEGGKSELINMIIRELAALPTDKQQDVLRYIRFLRNG